jgi:hypothetical protein
MMRILGRRLALVLAVGMLAFPATAAANNDPVVPADDCSGNPVAVGQPGVFGSVNATDIVDILRGAPNPVDGPASANNPGVSTGAKGAGNFSGACL